MKQLIALALLLLSSCAAYSAGVPSELRGPLGEKEAIYQPYGHESVFDPTGYEELGKVFTWVPPDLSRPNVFGDGLGAWSLRKGAHEDYGLDWDLLVFESISEAHFWNGHRYEFKVMLMGSVYRGER